MAGDFPVKHPTDARCMAFVEVIDLLARYRGRIAQILVDRAASPNVAKKAQSFIISTLVTVET